MSIGGIEASISIAVMFVVRNVPVIMHRHLFCVVARVVCSFPFFDFQNMGRLYVAIGCIALMYILLACSWCIPLTELPRIFRVCVAVRALDVVFCTCSLKFSCESSHIPR